MALFTAHNNPEGANNGNTGLTIATDQSFGTNLFTICGWLTHVPLGEGEIYGFFFLACNSSPQNVYCRFERNNDLPVFGLPAGIQFYTSTGVDTNPTFVAFQNNGLTNGARIFQRRFSDIGWTDQATGTVNLSGSVCNEVRIADIGDYTMNGSCEDVRVWSSYLSSDELLQESYRAYPVRRSGLWAWWPMRGTNQAQNLLDYSGNSRNLSLLAGNGPAFVNNKEVIGGRQAVNGFF